MRSYILLIFLFSISFRLYAQSWYGGESSLDFERPDISFLLLNNLEIISVKHDEPTRIHPNANLTILSNTDSSLKNPNLHDPIIYFRNALNSNYGKHKQLNLKRDLFIENYAGFDKETNFSFSTRVERELRDKSVRRVIEVMTEGKMIENRQYFETQLMGFNNKKLETYTYCSGFLYKAPVEGNLRRLYRKKNKLYDQAKFKCKTLTRPLCNSVYRGEQKTVGGRYKGTAFFDALESDILDLANYQQIQKNNMSALKQADRPGGRPHTAWPSDPFLHHYMGMGENGTLTHREAAWIVDECKEKIAFFHDPYNMIQEPSTGPSLAPSIPRKYNGRGISSLSSN